MSILSSFYQSNIGRIIWGPENTGIFNPVFARPVCLLCESALVADTWAGNPAKWYYCEACLQDNKEECYKDITRRSRNGTL
jgi:hypothetical protein